MRRTSAPVQAGLQRLRTASAKGAFGQLGSATIGRNLNA